jgi:hypothetical protein
MKLIRRGLQLALDAPFALVEEPQGGPHNLTGTAVAT